MRLIIGLLIFIDLRVVRRACLRMVIYLGSGDVFLRVYMFVLEECLRRIRWCVIGIVE